MVIAKLLMPHKMEILSLVFTAHSSLNKPIYKHYHIKVSFFINDNSLKSS